MGRVASAGSRPLLFAALGTGFVLRLIAILLTGDISQGANIWEYGEQGLCAHENGGQLCLHYPEGGAESYPSAYMPPLLSYVWFGVFSLFGDSGTARAAWLVTNMAAALGCIALTFNLSQKLWPSRWVAFAAAMLLACYPTFVYVTASYHQTNWAVLFLLSITMVGVKLATGDRPLAWGALGGVLCGLAALNRTELLIIGPLLLGLGAVLSKRTVVVVKAGAAVALATVLVLAPWTLRNFAEFGTFIPTAQSSGYNLWKGYNPYTNGSGNLSEDRGEPGGQAADAIKEAVPPGPDYEKRVQDAYSEVFQHDIGEASPQRLAGLAANKVVLLWGFDWTDTSTTRSVAYLVPWLIVNLLVVVGLVTAWRQRRSVRTAPAVLCAAALVLLTAAYAATSVHARYRMHIEPYLFIAAGIGIEALWQRLNAARAGRSSNTALSESTVGDRN
ncbi:hypothetical protein FHR72_003525 [Mycolicibacterium iranicum]|uniref:Glycosyltransferase RgtA/B/C/D-like domain-containing protein n=1 Tax=Mycolicibacterium iranicum TaxID=912594 RepID=A0A839Q7R7_MYCIR|nr:glycosyltransferase 87 family protein [Mycolicibacterium iranicum]MBB2992029.1 hypothetical protein [Mycolicibacterium iranicum]